MSSPHTDNVMLAKMAYAHLDRKPENRGQDDIQSKIDLLAQDVVFKVACSDDTPIYGGEIRGKKAVTDFYTLDDPGVLEDLELEAPPEFIGDGNRVVILGSQRYTIKKTGVTVRNKEAYSGLTWAIDLRRVG